MSYFEFTGETKVFAGVTLHRIRATEDLPSQNVIKGDLGGWVQKKENIGSLGWVADEAMILGEGYVHGLDSRVQDNAIVSGEAEIWGGSRIAGESIVADVARIVDSTVCGKANVSGFAAVMEKSIVGGISRVFGHAQIQSESIITGSSLIYGDATVIRSSITGGDIAGQTRIVMSNVDKAVIKGKAQVIQSDVSCFSLYLTDELVLHNAKIHSDRDFALVNSEQDLILIYKTRNESVSLSACLHPVWQEPGRPLIVADLEDLMNRANNDR